MKQSHVWWRILSVLAIVAFMVALPGVAHPSTAPQAWPAVNTAYADKVDAAVWQELTTTTDGKAAVLVKLAEQADLSAASKIEDWNARGWAVYNALHSTAERTQPAVMARMRVAESEGQASNIKSFWIVNLISVHADQETILSLASMPQVEAILPTFKLEKPDPIVEALTSSPEVIEWGVTKIRAPEVMSLIHI